MNFPDEDRQTGQQVGDKRLINEKSQYLKSHALDPVDWYPWGDDAFKRARKENKPIFLSIGYSSCHWCHVMAKESFCDPEVARLMNRDFISVLVDREERPDIDLFYMKAAQVMTGNGGWPLNIIMTPAKLPFFAGTYIPKESMYQRIGMLHLIPQIRQIWKENRKNVILTAKEISSLLIDRDGRGPLLAASVFDKAFGELREDFDEDNGGFGHAPKFPEPSNLFFLLRYWKRSGSKEALYMVEKTLRHMRSGGIFDQIGFGFHRYSTDSRWNIPHFEKMIYDQALASMAYLEAYQVTKKPVYAKVAAEIFESASRDMFSGSGYYSSVDSDSEGQEGKYYRWEEEEIRSVLPEQDYGKFSKIYATQETDPEEDGDDSESVLRLRNYSDSGQAVDWTDTLDKADQARKKLLDARSRRTMPLIDRKILADWNSLMAVALASGARILGSDAYESRARDVISFIMSNLYHEGRLYHLYQDGTRQVEAFAADYSYLIWALLEMYETTFEESYLEDAAALCRKMIDLFWDKDNGGFTFSEPGRAAPASSIREVYDGVLPSANSVALLNLAKLSRLTGDALFRQKSEELVKAFSKLVNDSPSSYTMFLSAYDFVVSPGIEIIIRGDSSRPEAKKMISAIRSEFVPNKIVALNPDSSVFPQEIRQMGSAIEKPVAYICSDYACRQPATDVEDMLRLLNL